MPKQIELILGKGLAQRSAILC